MPKRSLEDGGKRERANAAKAANARERNIAQQYLNAGPSIGNLARAAYHWYNSVPWLGGQNENGLIIIKGDVPTPGMRSPKAIAQTIKTITKANAAKINPAQWTAAQDAAIARGDMVEAQRLRDLHFKVSAPGNVVTKEGMPIHNYHGTNTNFNEFDLKYFGQHDPGDRGYGFYFSQNRDVASDYGNVVNDYYLNATTPYTGEDWYSKYINRGDKENIVKQIIKKIDEEDALKIEHLKEKYPSLDDDLIRNAVSKSSSSERENIINNLGNIENTDIYLSPYENVVYEPNQIKLADAVTYDDNGIRIPLGERDNFNINDIRYALIPFIAGGIGYGTYNRGKKHNGGSIHIAPSKRGTFTTAATKHGMGVQEFASRVLRNKDSYSPAMVKKANFARNASKWNH